MRNILLIILILAFVASTSFATTRYVDDCTNALNTYEPIGHTCTGGGDLVYDTIQHCADVVVAGDSCIVTDASYIDDDADDIVATINASGTAGSNGLDPFGQQNYDSTTFIIFKAENYLGAIIDGQSNATDRGFLLDNAHYIKIEGFKFTGLKTTGLNTRNSGSTTEVIVKDNIFQNIGLYTTNVTSGGNPGGIFVGKFADHFTFDGNVFHNIGRLNPFTDPPAAQSTCTKVDDTIHCYNHDHGIYIVGSHASFTNNIFYNLWSGWAVQASGYYGSQYGNYYYFVNNTFSSNHPQGHAQLLLWGTSNNTVISSNVSVNSNGGFIYNLGGTKTQILVSDNVTDNATLIKSSNSTTAGWTISGNLTSETGIVTDYEIFDFTLPGDSPAVDTGDNTYCADTDFDDNLRPLNIICDMGAYEYLPGSPSFVEVKTPVAAGETIIIGASYTITYTLTDDDDVITANFFYDLDNDKSGGTPITGPCASAPESVGSEDATCAWDTSMITGCTAGCYIYGEVVGDASVSNVSAGTLTILLTAPTGGRNSGGNSSFL